MMPQVTRAMLDNVTVTVRDVREGLCACCIIFTVTAQDEAKEFDGYVPYLDTAEVSCKQDVLDLAWKKVEPGVCAWLQYVRRHRASMASAVGHAYDVPT
jgi:hypothetical protein